MPEEDGLDDMDSTTPPRAGGGETAPARPATTHTGPGTAEGATTTDLQARDQDRDK